MKVTVMNFRIKKPETGNRQPATGNHRTEIFFKSLFIRAYFCCTA